MMDRNLVILAGGISSRMRKATHAIPSLDPLLRQEAREKSKTMIGVGEGHRPFLDYLLYNAHESGYRDVVIVIGERDRSIRDYYSRAAPEKVVHGLTLSYAVQSIPAGRGKPLGTADALLQALRATPRWRGTQFTVCNSDNLYSRRALTLMLECGAPGAMIDYDSSALGISEDRISRFAVTEKSSDGFLTRILEKPAPGEIARIRDGSGRVGVSMNIFRLTYDLIYPFLEQVPPHPDRNEKELPAAVQMMVKAHPRSVRAIPLSEAVPDLTSPSDIPQVQDFLRKAFPDFTSKRE